MTGYGNTEGFFKYLSNIHCSLYHPTDNFDVESIMAKFKEMLLTLHPKRVKKKNIWNITVQAL
jgi:hypothetical protein